MFLQGGYSGIFNTLLGAINHSENEKNRERHNITNIDGFDGVDNVGIPHRFSRVKFKENYYYCENDNVLVYTGEGRFLFSCASVMNLGGGTFLRQEVNSKKKKEDCGWCLCHDNVKLTGFIYKPSGLSNSFNKSGFIILNILGEYSHKAVLNKKGEEVFYSEDYNEVYLHESLLSTNKGYVNLFTHQYICEKGYSSTMKTDQDMFVEVSSLVYQINMFTGEFVVHGNDKKKQPPLTSKEEVERDGKRDVLIKERKEMQNKINVETKRWEMLGRNDKCLCGSKKKFKKCCIKSWKSKLITKHKEG